MPELPEVETIANSIKEIIGLNITHITIQNEKSASSNIKNALNKKITSISRHGKYLIISLSNSYKLLIHFRMTGHLLFSKEKIPLKHERVQFIFNDNIILKFLDIRKFGKVYLTKNNVKLGPDALTITVAEFINSLKNRMLKPFLLDQSIIAGLGNIYVDEALWLAKLHPERSASSLNKYQVKTLLKSIKTVLYRGIKYKGCSLGFSSLNFRDAHGVFGKNQNHLNAYNKTNTPCKRCLKLITKKKISQRSSHFCEKCQN